MIFQLTTGGPPTLPLVQTLPTGGKGGAGRNAGILQMRGDVGAVANFGSNTVSEFVRDGDDVYVAGPITLAPGCLHPDSAALTDGEVFVAGATCVESHAWPAGTLDGSIVHLTDSSAAQIALGNSWGAVTMKSDSVLQLGLTSSGTLNGVATPVALPGSANNTPLGGAFWAISWDSRPRTVPDSFATVDVQRNVYPIAGPTPPYPSNAPCWVANGPGNVWHTGNVPGQAISIFSSNDKGGTFYKSVSLPGAPTDITVSEDGRWLAVICTANDSGYVSVFAIDAHGDLSPEATADPVGVTAFNGVAISQ